MIETISLGKTSLVVPRLCLGTWQAADWQSSNDQGFLATIKHAIEQGLTFFDTAAVYGNGHSEKLLGQAIKGRRDQVVIATKFSFSDGAPEKLRRSLEASLKRLGTDYIDLYQQHWPPKKPPLADTIAELEKLKAEGKIRAVGVSNWMETEWQEFGDPGRIDCLQPCYSLLWRAVEKVVLPLCRRHQIAVIPYSPLCQGILAGRFKGAGDLPAKKSDPRNYNIRLKPDQINDTLKVVQAVEDLAKRYGKTPAQVALRWLLDREDVSAPIVGASSPGQVDENLGALGWRLESTDWQALAEISRPLSENLKPHDTLWNWHPREM